MVPASLAPPRSLIITTTLVTVAVAVATRVIQMADINSYHLSMDELRKERSGSYLLTAAFFLQDQLTVQIPPFHEVVWQQLRELRLSLMSPDSRLIKKVFTVPREHNKTTIVKLFCADALRVDPNVSFILYCSATFSSAANACRDIVRWLTSDLEQQLWGESERIKQNETEGLWILRIPTAYGKVKEVILKAVGVDKQVRGLNIFSRRPDTVIADDIEDLNTADGGKQQLKLDEWFFGTLLKATATQAMVILIGNIIKSSTLLARLCEDSTWNPTRFGAIVRGDDGKLRPLWEGKHTLDSLLTEYRSYRRLGLGHVWESEMMNLSRDVSLAELIPQSCLVPDVLPDRVTCGFITVDPAFGVNAVNDESAITVHVQTASSPVPIVIDSDHGRWKERVLFDHVIDLVYRWGLTTVVIEAVAAQRLLIPLFRSFMLEDQLNVDMLSFMPIQGQREANAKSARINAFRNSCITGNYSIAESQMEFKLALEEWSPESAKHDDLVDSGSFGLLIWDQMGRYIEAQGRMQQVGALLTDVNGSYRNGADYSAGISELQTSIL